MKNLPRSIFLFLALWLPTTLWAAQSVLSIEDAWIREAPPMAKSQAGYMKLHNPGAKALLLIGATSEQFASVMLHQTVEEDGFAKMKHLMAVKIDAGASLYFNPNGLHLMLMQPVKHLKAGDKVQMTLEFESGDSQDFEMLVREPNYAPESMPMEHPHHE